MIARMVVSKNIFFPVHFACYMQKEQMIAGYLLPRCRGGIEEKN